MYCALWDVDVEAGMNVVSFRFWSRYESGVRFISIPYMPMFCSGLPVWRKKNPIWCFWFSACHICYVMLWDAFFIWYTWSIKKLLMSAGTTMPLASTFTPFLATSLASLSGSYHHSTSVLMILSGIVELWWSI